MVWFSKESSSYVVEDRSEDEIEAGSPGEVREKTRVRRGYVERHSGGRVDRPWGWWAGVGEGKRCLL